MSSIIGIGIGIGVGIEKIQNTLNLLHLVSTLNLLHFRLLHLITQYLRPIMIMIMIMITIKNNVKL